MENTSQGIEYKTNGCMVLRHRTKRLQALLDQSNIDTQNLTIVSGCAVIRETEEESLDLIRESFRDTQPDHRVVITGCLPKINRQRIVDEFGSRVIIVSELSEVPQALGIQTVGSMDSVVVPDSDEEHSKGDPLAKTDAAEHALHRGFHTLSTLLKDPWIEDFYRYQTKGRHFWREPHLREVLVTEGCHYNCAFCATKLAIGHTRSRPLDLVMRDIETARNDNISKIVLQGDEIGNYKSGDSTLETIVRQFKERPSGGVSSLAFRYIFPSPLLRFGSWLEEAFRDGSVYFVCTALQTGDEDIARSMSRPANVWAAADRMAGLRQVNPKAFIHTQIIVGYPGETEEQFERSVKLAKDYEFDYISHTRFDARPGTRAATLENQLPSEVIRSRFERLGAVIEDIRMRRLARHAVTALERAGIRTPDAVMSPLDIVRNIPNRELSALNV